MTIVGDTVYICNAEAGALHARTVTLHAFKIQAGSTTLVPLPGTTVTLPAPPAGLKPSRAALATHGDNLLISVANASWSGDMFLRVHTVPVASLQTANSAAATLLSNCELPADSDTDRVLTAMVGDRMLCVIGDEHAYALGIFSSVDAKRECIFMAKDMRWDGVDPSTMTRLHLKRGTGTVSCDRHPIPGAFTTSANHVDLPTVPETVTMAQAASIAAGVLAALSAGTCHIDFPDRLPEQYELHDFIQKMQLHMRLQPGAESLGGLLSVLQQLIQAADVGCEAELMRTLQYTLGAIRAIVLFYARVRPYRSMPEGSAPLVAELGESLLQLLRSTSSKGFAKIEEMVGTLLSDGLELFFSSADQRFELLLRHMTTFQAQQAEGYTGPRLSQSEVTMMNIFLQRMSDPELIVDGIRGTLEEPKAATAGTSAGYDGKDDEAVQESKNDPEGDDLLAPTALVRDQSLEHSDKLGQSPFGRFIRSLVVISDAAVQAALDDIARAHGLQDDTKPSTATKQLEHFVTPAATVLSATTQLYLAAIWSTPQDQRSPSVAVDFVADMLGSAAKQLKSACALVQKAAELSEDKARTVAQALSSQLHDASTGGSLALIVSAISVLSVTSPMAVRSLLSNDAFRESFVSLVAALSQLLAAGSDEYGKQEVVEVDSTKVVKEVVECAHPYSNNMDETKRVQIPDARQYMVTFDPETHLESGCDYIWLTRDEDKEGERLHEGNHLSGRASNFPEKLKITAPHFYVHMHTDGSCVYWGYRMHVSAVVGSKTTIKQAHWLVQVFDACAYFSAVAVSQQVRSAPQKSEATAGAAAHSDAEWLSLPLLAGGLAADATPDEALIEEQSAVVAPTGAVATPLERFERLRELFVDEAKTPDLMEAKQMIALLPDTPFMALAWEMIASVPRSRGAVLSQVMKANCRDETGGSLHIAAGFRAAACAMLLHHGLARITLDFANSLPRELNEDASITDLQAHKPPADVLQIWNVAQLVRRRITLAEDDLQPLPVLNRALLLLSVLEEQTLSAGVARKRWQMIAKGMISPVAVKSRGVQAATDSDDPMMVGKWMTLVGELRAVSDIRSMQDFRRALVGRQGSVKAAGAAPVSEKDEIFESSAAGATRLSIRDQVLLMCIGSSVPSAGTLYEAVQAVNSAARDRMKGLQLAAALISVLDHPTGRAWVLAALRAATDANGGHVGSGLLGASASRMRCLNTMHSSTLNALASNMQEIWPSCLVETAVESSSEGAPEATGSAPASAIRGGRRASIQSSASGFSVPQLQRMLSATSALAQGQQDPRAREETAATQLWEEILQGMSPVWLVILAPSADVKPTLSTEQLSTLFRIYSNSATGDSSDGTLEQAAFARMWRHFVKAYISGLLHVHQSIEEDSTSWYVDVIQDNRPQLVPLIERLSGVSLADVQREVAVSDEVCWQAGSMLVSTLDADSDLSISYDEFMASFNDGIWRTLVSFKEQDEAWQAAQATAEGEAATTDTAAEEPVVDPATGVVITPQIQAARKLFLSMLVMFDTDFLLSDHQVLYDSGVVDVLQTCIQSREAWVFQTAVHVLCRLAKQCLGSTTADRLQKLLEGTAPSTAAVDDALAMPPPTPPMLRSISSVEQSSLTSAQKADTLLSDLESPLHQCLTAAVYAIWNQLLEEYTSTALHHTQHRPVAALQGDHHVTMITPKNLPIATFSGALVGSTPCVASCVAAAVELSHEFTLEMRLFWPSVATLHRWLGDDAPASARSGIVMQKGFNFGSAWQKNRLLPPGVLAENLVLQVSIDGNGNLAASLYENPAEPLMVTSAVPLTEDTYCTVHLGLREPGNRATPVLGGPERLKLNEFPDHELFLRMSAQQEATVKVPGTMLSRPVQPAAEKERNVESEHPYRAGTDETHGIVIPGAQKLVLKFTGDTKYVYCRSMFLLLASNATCGSNLGAACAACALIAGALIAAWSLSHNLCMLPGVM